jgi:lysozyme
MRKAMNIDNLVINIKENEGFRGDAYKDTLGFDTVGYGTKMPISKKEATVLLRMRLNDKIEELARRKPLFTQLPYEVQEILAEMAYNLGAVGLLKFKKTWLYLEEGEFESAGLEMRDSLWYHQVRNRAEELAQRMEKT